MPEAQLIRDLLVEWGVSRRSIVLDTASKNTRENAINAAVALQENGCQSSLLVTSAWHMPRAIAAFKRVGVEMFPVSVDVGFVEGDSIVIRCIYSDGRGSGHYQFGHQRVDGYLGLPVERLELRLIH